MRAVGYIRGSTEKKLNNRQSLSEIEEYAHSEGWKLCHVYSDDEASGGNLNRDGLKELIRDIGNKKFEMVIAASLEQLTTNYNDFKYLTNRIFEKNAIGLRALHSEVYIPPKTNKWKMAFKGILIIVLTSFSTLIVNYALAVSWGIPLAITLVLTLLIAGACLFNTLNDLIYKKYYNIHLIGKLIAFLLVSITGMLLCKYISVALAIGLTASECFGTAAWCYLERFEFSRLEKMIKIRFISILTSPIMGYFFTRLLPNSLVSKPSLALLFYLMLIYLFYAVMRFEVELKTVIAWFRSLTLPLTYLPQKAKLTLLYFLLTILVLAFLFGCLYFSMYSFLTSGNRYIFYSLSKENLGLLDFVLYSIAIISGLPYKDIQPVASYAIWISTSESILGKVLVIGYLGIFFASLGQMRIKKRQNNHK